MELLFHDMWQLRVAGAQASNTVAYSVLFEVLPHGGITFRDKLSVSSATLLLALMHYCCYTLV